MTTDKSAYPLAIDLPGGVRAELASSSPPRYAVAGEMTAIDITIPDDLMAAGWFWNGSFLSWRERPDSCGIAIATCTFPPPGYPAVRGDCMTQAREFERIRGEVHITSLEIRAKVKPPKKGKKRDKAEPTQTEMTLEAD